MNYDEMQLSMIQPREPIKYEASDTESPKPPTVLVVVGEDSLLNFVRMSLQRKGNIVLTAKDASSALNCLKGHNVDLAVVDLMLPQMSGIELVDQMRSFTTRIPLIVLTDMDFPEVKLKAISIGADDLLNKPFTTEELVARIEGILRRLSEDKMRGSRNEYTGQF